MPVLRVCDSPMVLGAGGGTDPSTLRRLTGTFFLGGARAFHSEKIPVKDFS